MQGWAGSRNRQLFEKLLTSSSTMKEWTENSSDLKHSVIVIGPIHRWKVFEKND